MAGQRSGGLPLRLHQILSGGRHSSPSLKLESEPPPKVKAFIDRVIKSPLHDIAIPLSGFRWEYNKGNFHHWRPLFLHFETYFRTYLSFRKDLLLSDSISEEDPFPKHSILQILRVMQIILENCQNKSSFSGLEHFKLLLASSDPEILIVTLETLSSLVKINPSKIHMNGKLIGCGEINSCLLSLAQGWGSKEEGLGLYSCVMANERSQQEGFSLFPSDVGNQCSGTQYRLGSTLHFEFNISASQDGKNTMERSKSSNLRVIHVPDLHLQREEDLSILKHCVEHYNVPPEHRFSLLTRIRYANSFRSPKTCRLYSRICILAFIVMVQSSDAHDELSSFFANEPEYTNELIRLVQADESVPANVRALSMLALGAQLAAYASSHERARILSGSSIISAGGNRLMLLDVLHKAVLSLSNPCDHSSPLFIDALLQFFLLHVLSSSSSGSAIRSSLMVPPLLSFLQDTDSAHMHLVCSSVKILQKLMEYSGPAVSTFKDLGGVELLTRRLQIEVNRVIGPGDNSSDKMVICDLSKSDEDCFYAQKRLIKTMLKALGSATYSPANASRPQNSHDNTLPSSLAMIFQNATIFGGDIYFSAVTLMSEIIHKDPTCFNALYESGLPTSFLSSVTAGVLPSSRALICVPNGLGAICLNVKGQEAVKETAALRFLVRALTSRKYLVAMNEGVVLLANAVEELFRHVSSLRSTGVDIIIEIITKLAALADHSSRRNENTAMETDADDGVQEGHDLVNVMSSAADGVSNEQFLHLSIFHLMVLVHRTMENTEICRLFVERGGIETLMKLLLRPSITQSSEGMPIALHSTVVFKGFTQHHSAPLARAFSSALRDYIKKAMDGFQSLSYSLLLNPRITSDSGAFSSLFVIEFLLFLAASKDNRWISALLSEFGDTSKDVLEDIGRVHREILWQLALLDDSKPESDIGSYTGVTEAQRVEQAAGESDEQRLPSIRQYIDPLLRRRVSGWSIESQVSDLISIYRDLGRSAGGQQRFGIDGYPTLRLASSSQTQSSGSVDGSDGSRKEKEKERSYYSTCCDMMRSLSYHISHLFMELGKSMLLTSRRENNPVNVSPPIISVGSTISLIVLDHLNFAGHDSPSSSENSLYAKCRYLGKVIDFIDGVILDRPESCNPILVNCFYGRGVIQSILTTFEATSQLLFAVNRVPASPMETDDRSSKQCEKEETDDSWIYGPMASYALLMDHLATSSIILSSSGRQFLEQPLINVTGSYPQNAESFVKILQSKILRTVLPIWTHPRFAECSMEFIGAMISIMKHIYSGVEVRNGNGNSGARISGPPPNESAISLIVEMGFSRSRAEEALRQVGTDSVEIATDWLFSHPEEPQEDDELARALAMSLGSATASKEDETMNSGNAEQEEETISLPPVDDLLSACLKLLQGKEPLAFPVRDLLLVICSQNDEHRSKVLTFIMDHVKSFHVTSESFNGTLLSALFHVLALILHQDAAARELASRSGLVKAALSLLSEWNMDWCEDDKSQVPKWVTACFLSIDRMLQVDQKLPSEITDFEQFRKDNLTAQTALAIDGRKKNSQLKVTSGTNLDIDDQKRLLEISCRCIQRHLPSETMHAVLQLCATLTKVHSVAVSFLDAGGLPALLSLPTSSLFPGFNNVAAAIIRHILEDPHTLQQAMELEIRHSLVASANRHSNGRVTPRNFVQNLSFVISRDPVVFMRAAQSVCQIEMVGDRPYVVLLKDREKEKSKERDKTVENDKQLASNGKVVTSDATLMVPGSGLSKTPDSTAKSAKAYKKSPQSFTNVIELLLDSIVTFVPSSNAAQLVNGIPSTPSLADMDIDNAPAKGKGKAIVVSSEDSKTDNQEAASSLAKTVFILKLMTEILLTYASSIHVVLRRDAELSSARGPSRGSSANCNGGIFHHVLHNFLPYPGVLKKDKKVDGDWRQKLASRASHFLVASSIRSAEGRRRVFAEINNLFCEFIDSSNGCRAPDSRMHAFVDLLNDILAARSPSGSYISAEASITFINVGLVRSLSRTLQILDLDQTDSPKVVTGIVKALETVTKEHVHSVESAKGDNSSKLASDQNQQESSYNDGNRFQSLDTASQPDHAEEVADHMETFNAGQTSGGSDSVTDDMDHDRDMDGRFSHEHEDDFMHEAAEDAGSLGNGISAVEITFDIQHNAGDDSGEEDEDEDMSADEGDEVDEDDDEEDEENNDLEEDDVHQLSHPDMDQDDHEMDDDEFDEDVLEEEEEEDDDEDGVILRLEEGVNGMNVFDHIEVLSGSNNLSNETLRVMPLDIFGSRRQGRTTSIYNLLGRSGDHGLPLDHPLLEEPSSLRHLVHQRQSENAVDMAFSDRNHESTSTRLEAIFRSLRSGRHGHRFNMWLDDGQQRGGSTAPAVPQGIEELLVSQLRRPSSSQITDQDASGILPQEIGVPDQVERPDVGVREENPAEVNDNNETMNIPSPISAIGGSGNGTGTDNDDMLHGRDASNASDQVTDMQYERSNATIRDVEAVSQASSGSGATLGESLRSLEVEIGSVDGPDDGERQGPADRLALGDLQASRMRRSLGSAAPISGRDVALESVSEVPSHSQEANQSGLHEEQQVDRTVDPDPIDPTFLEALPEELRAEVLSSRQNQVPQPSNDQSQSAGDIDPEFLAALPPDIREEVLAQQRAQRQHQSRELEGQPVEMDAVSIIATFPSEIREEVLLTSPDTLLATLTPALVAEANMLRERFARRYHNSGLFGMYSRNRRGESSGGGELIGSSMDRAGAAIDSRKSAAGKLIEADGAPLVDTDALKALIRLLRVVQLPYKGQLQRLLLNLCTHQAIRTSLVKILVDMLMLDLRGPAKTSSDAESPFRLYGCQSHVTYSRPQFSNGVPPLVSRRVLETLTYLARNHPNVAKLLLHLELPQSFACVAESSVYGRGKAIMEEDKVEAKKGEFSIVLLFSLLNEPLYMRSIAHLEQLLNLLEVVMINAENDSISSKSGSSPEQQPSGSETAVQGNDTTADVAGSSNGNDIKPSKTGNHSSPSSSLTLNRESSVQAVLLSLPQTELRLLCSLLAREGLSDNAYNLVAEVLKKLVAIAPSYCHLFITELANSLQSLTLLARNELHLYEDSEKALLSTSSSNGTAILRVLQALSSLITAVHEKERPSQLLEKGQADFLSQVWDINTSLESLWSELSNCIGKIENFSETTSDLVSMSGNLASANVGASAPLPAGAQNILPYIESFFVTCEKLRPGQPDTVQDLASTCDVDDGGTSIVGQRPSGICSKIDEKHPVFVKFSEKHRRLLNAFIRQNPGLLEKSFSLMLKIPRLIDFDNKRSHFRSKIKHQHDHHHSPVRISVRRAYILEDSYNQLRMRSPQELKGRLTVHFQGEEGIDAGGLTREWYQLLSRVIFDKGALLFTTVGNESTFQPNPNSVYQTEHLSYFKFVGRVVGKALFDGQLLDVHFTRSFYKHILGVKVTYHDIEAIDPDYFKNLKWMLENDITDVLDLTFSMDADEEKLILYERTEVTDSELIPDGRNIKVTEENKHEYVDRVAEHRLTTAIRPQINAFMEGFNELIPRDLVSIFNDKELELLISGLPDIDLDDLRANTEYSGYSSASPVIQWFWEVLQGFSKEDKARFLQFVTGTSKVPLEGFNALQGISGIQRFQIHKAYGSPDHLPSAHTCFNQLDLPEYASKEKLQERLLLAIHEANEGFGFG